MPLIISAKQRKAEKKLISLLKAAQAQQTKLQKAMLNLEHKIIIKNFSFSKIFAICNLNKITIQEQNLHKKRLEINNLFNSLSPKRQAKYKDKVKKLLPKENMQAQLNKLSAAITESFDNAINNLNNPKTIPNVPLTGISKDINNMLTKCLKLTKNQQKDKNLAFIYAMANFCQDNMIFQFHLGKLLDIDDQALNSLYAKYKRNKNKKLTSRKLNFAPVLDKRTFNLNANYLARCIDRYDKLQKSFSKFAQCFDELDKDTKTSKEFKTFASGIKQYKGTLQTTGNNLQKAIGNTKTSLKHELVKDYAKLTFSFGTILYNSPPIILISLISAATTILGLSFPPALIATALTIVVALTLMRGTIGLYKAMKKFNQSRKNIKKHKIKLDILNRTSLAVNPLKPLNKHNQDNKNSKSIKPHPGNNQPRQRKRKKQKPLAN